MLFAFVVLPESLPWYYELLVFNLGLWSWLITSRILKKGIQAESQSTSNLNEL